MVLSRRQAQSSRRCGEGSMAMTSFQSGDQGHVKRFNVQLMSETDLSPARRADGLARFYDTLDEAQSSCDKVWKTPGIIRQEITDTETEERWFRADGQQDWHHYYAARRSA